MEFISEKNVCTECGEKFQPKDHSLIGGICPTCLREAYERAKFNTSQTTGWWDDDGWEE